MSDAALVRAPEFERRFFEAIFDDFHETDGIRCLRWSVQPGDGHAVFDLPEGGAGVQVDPDMEYLIVWGADG